MKKIISAVAICCLIITTVNAQNYNANIRINQLGYFPLAPKIAVIVEPIKSDSFFILPIGKTDTLYKAKLGAMVASGNSSLKTRLADFTNFRIPGTYQLHLLDGSSSYPFTIAESVVKPLAIASIKGYYFQRASIPLLEQFAGQWARAAGTLDKEVVIHPSAASNSRTAGSVISTPGGWYDAADYNKYIVNSGITIGTLLSTYEDFPVYFKSVNTNIPESNDPIPDILNEILYNLRWMFTMQDPLDGGVYNKVTETDFSGIVMPDKANSMRYVVQKGTAASLDFCAVMAQASRVFENYKKQLPGLSDSCLNAAKFAWDWVQKNPAVEYNQTAMNRMMYKPAINTGAYGDKVFIDEWFWAASELFVTTNNEDYYKFITRSINNNLSLPSWNNVFALGYYTLIRNSKKMETLHAKDLSNIKRWLLEFADNYLESQKKNAFNTVMGQSKDDFVWGSNANAANQALLLLNAYHISKDRKYADAALSNLDYLLGRNATGYCFVTGFGSKSPMFPHHRPSMADNIEAPVPGLLVGGPNPAKQDKCVYQFSEPETSYSDTDCSFSSNEIAINWNAPLVYITNAIEALQYELAYSVQKKK